VAAAVLAGGTAAATRHSVTLRDDTGVRVVVPQPATRIVSLISSDTQILLALGLARRVVGVDTDSRRYMPPPYLAEARRLPSVGNSYDPGPNLEVIARRRPDLILSSTAVRGNAALRRLGVPVLVLAPKTLAGIERDILLVGRATGTTARARRLVASLRRTADSLHELAARQRRHPSVFVELGYPGIYTAGPGSYIDSLLSILDARNVVDGVSRLPFPEIDPEVLVRLDPQVIILDDTPYATPRSVAQRPAFAAIAAVRDHRVYGNVNVNLLSEPGPAVVEALRVLYRDLYPGTR
jgi:iron complex transport system substrate-binding protein